MPLGQAEPPTARPPPHQRYLDEAEREKQQYMKELRAYQQSEAYKMCTEKLQEKKIKKGARGPSPPGSWVRALSQATRADRPALHGALVPSRRETP